MTPDYQDKSIVINNESQPIYKKSENKCLLINDHFQNYKCYGIPKANLVLADIPYNVGKNAYGSNPSWYIDGDNKKGESKLANTAFFDTDKRFMVSEFLHFCLKMIKKEPKQRGDAPAMIVFCEFEQQFEIIEKAKKYGINGYINLIFRKNFSAQVLKANMRIVGNAEYALLLYRDKLPKFNNKGKMIFNIIDWERDDKNELYEKIHPCLPKNQKVFFNNEWKNVQNVKINDTNNYGKVIAKTEHYADKLVKIIVGENKIISTFNHPFLVKRDNKIYWIIAEQIKKNDLILSNVFVYYTQKPIKKELQCKKNTKKQEKDISDLQKTKKGNSGLSIVLFGKNIMGKFLSVCIYIIRILIGETIKLKTYNLLVPLNTSGYTQVVDLSMESGKNLVKFAENLKKLIKKIGIILVDGLMGKSVKNAISKNQLKQERFLLRKVGSVKIINQKTKVYNLTMDNIPVFDTLIGVSHNTQKPVKLLEKLIEIFTDEDDIVIDPVAGSGATLIAANNLGRDSYGFEIKKEYYNKAKKWIEMNKLAKHEMEKYGFAKTLINETQWTLF